MVMATGAEVPIAARLVRIDRFPIKSLDGQSVARSRVTAAGALWGDRRWRLVDGRGKTVNAKGCAAIHRIRATFDGHLTTVTLAWGGDRADGPANGPANGPEPATFSLETADGQAAIAQWCSTALGITVTLAEDRDRGFPDDVHFWGPTLISTATLTAVASWFPDLGVDELRRRLRTNLEIDGVPPFWEDHLYGPTVEAAPVPFRLGSVELLGCNPCLRCVVPTRHPDRGEPLPRFAAIVSHQRQATLPPTVPRSRFEPFYRLALNTRITPQEADSTGDRVLAVGDRLGEP
jgi:uncharacterized protein YcbX